MSTYAKVKKSTYVTTLGVNQGPRGSWFMKGKKQRSKISLDCLFKHSVTQTADFNNTFYEDIF
jgi:hypothetical protein